MKIEAPTAPVLGAAGLAVGAVLGSRTDDRALGGVCGALVGFVAGYILEGIEK